MIMLELELESETQPNLNQLRRQLNFFAVKYQGERELLHSHQLDRILVSHELNEAMSSAYI